MTRIFKNDKHVFWQALLIALLIFTFGLLIGILVETWRQSTIEDLYVQAELQFMDLRIQNELFDISEISCGNAINENLKFADQIYFEALILKDLEESQTLTKALKLQHKKYDLLRTLLWVNSIKIKKRCGNFSTVVYLYEYNPDIEKRAQQTVFSRVLGEIKDRQQENIILIPIAGDIGLVSTQTLMSEYNVTSLPVVIVDEEHLFYESGDLESLEALL